MTLFQAFGQFAGQAAAQTDFDFITSQTFSSVSSVSFDNCFSADYDQYLLLFDFTSATGTPRVRLRSAGSDATGSDYDLQRIDVYSTSVVGTRGNLDGFGGFYMGSTRAPHYVIMQDPFNTVATTLNIATGYDMNNPSMIPYVNCHTLASSYDGFTVYFGTGMTGSVYVYGWRV